jgi:hypothetical protein
MSRFRYLPAALGIAVLFALPVRAGEPQDRKINVLEKIIDTTLIESENALVYAGGVAEGVYLEGYGAFFRIEFTFVEKSGMKIMEHLNDMDSLKVYWREMIGLGEGDSPGAERRREQLNKVEDELVDTIMNYGATLGDALRDDEWVTLVAFPWQETWDVTPDPVRSLLIRARYGDLKNYAADRLSDDKMRERIEVVEDAD